MPDKEILQGDSARRFCKEILQGDSARRFCKEILQGVSARVSARTSEGHLKGSE
jgi:hypothetical protein